MRGQRLALQLVSRPFAVLFPHTDVLDFSSLKGIDVRTFSRTV